MPTTREYFSDAQRYLGGGGMFTSDCTPLVFHSISCACSRCLLLDFILANFPSDRYGSIAGLEARPKDRDKGDQARHWLKEAEKCA